MEPQNCLLLYMNDGRFQSVEVLLTRIDFLLKMAFMYYDPDQGSSARLVQLC